MKEYISRVLDQIMQSLYKRREKKLNPILGGFITGFIALLAANICGYTLLNGFSSSFLEKILFNFIAFIIGLPIYVSVEKRKTKKINEMLSDVREEEQQLLAQVLKNSNPVLNNYDIGDFVREIRKSPQSHLAFEASIDPSKMSLKELKTIVAYIRTLLQIPEEEDELTGVTLSHDYKPGGSHSEE